MKQQNADGKGGWKRAARAGQGCSWDWEHWEDWQTAGEEQREFKECRSKGMMSGVKGTELMQVLCSGLGGSSDSHHGPANPEVWNSREQSWPAFL